MIKCFDCSKTTNNNDKTYVSTYYGHYLRRDCYLKSYTECHNCKEIYHKEEMIFIDNICEECYKKEGK